MKWATHYESLKLINQRILWVIVLLMVTSSFPAIGILSEELKQEYDLCDIPFEENERAEERDSEENEENEKFKEFEPSTKSNLKLSTKVYHNFLYIGYFIRIHKEVLTPPPEFLS